VRWQLGQAARQAARALIPLCKPEGKEGLPPGPWPACRPGPRGLAPQRPGELPKQQHHRRGGWGRLRWMEIGRGHVRIRAE